MNLSSEVVYNILTLTHLAFEERLLAMVGIAALIGLLFVATRVYWMRILHQIVRHPERLPIFSYNRSLRAAGQDLLFILKLLLIVQMVMAVSRLYSERPYVLAASPSEYTRFETADPAISIEFSVPVATDEMTFHTSPEVAGSWEWEPGLLGLPYSRKVTFHPQESFYPGNEVVVYMVGLKQLWYPGPSHEHALSFQAPIIPAIRETLPKEGTHGVSIDTPIVVSFNGPIGDFLNFQVNINPDPGTFHLTTQDNQLIIELENDLTQGENYTVEVFRTPRSYTLPTREDLKLGDTEMIGSFSFETVPAPLVESYSPRGDAVTTDQPIQIVFDQDIQPESLEQRFRIEPKITGTTEWENNRVLIFRPETPLAKDTSYTLHFQSGIKSNSGGTVAEDFSLSFKTIGPVKATHITPINGSTGNDPTQTNITIQFDQPVDHTSAEQLFSIFPSTPGSFIWQGNKLTYQPTQPLAYSTQYRINLAAGVKTTHGLDSNTQYSSSFTTKSQTFALNIPWFKQEESFTCNIAAARMALAYRGVNLSEDSIQFGIGAGGDPNVNWVDGYGVHVSPVANYISQYRPVEVKTGWNLTELLQEVQNGNPVVVWWYNRYSQPAGTFQLASGASGYNGMHSEVVRGFIGDPNNPSHILTNDPWRGQLTYTKEGFLSTWNYINNTALIVR